VLLFIVVTFDILDTVVIFSVDSSGLDAVTFSHVVVELPICVTSEQQTFSPDVDSDTTIKSTTKIHVTEEGTSQITAQKNISDGSVMDTTAETMETGQTTLTAEEFTTENVMTVNTTDVSESTSGLNVCCSDVT
jgi:hypothetical protein